MIASLELQTHSPRQTQEIGKVLGRNAAAGDLFLLAGGLGVGKTCLTQGIAQGLEVQEHARSPTFVLVSQYTGRLPMYHIDLYRLDNLEEIQDLGLEEYLDESGVCVVEWAEKALHLFPPQHLSIQMDYLGKRTRRLIFTAPDEHHQRLIEAIKDHTSVSGH